MVLCQVSQGGVPFSVMNKENATSVDTKIRLTNDINLITLPKIDTIYIDSIKRNNILYECFQFAKGFEVDIDVKTRATVDSLDIGRLFRLAIYSEGANSINIIFKEYALPHGAKLYIYNKQQTDMIGAFTSDNNKSCNKLACVPVLGDEIILEYFEPYNTNITGKLVIGKINHDFMGVKNGDFDTTRNNGCQVGINCSPEGDDWQTEKKAVCKILIGGTSFCSGVLLNNTNEDGTAFVLTANHCVNSQELAEESVFIFSYERLSCEGTAISDNHSISAATLRATNYLSDFTLLELSRKPLSTWEVYYAGWDCNDIQYAGGVGIHHPNGDYKKISTFNIIPKQSDCLQPNRTEHFYLIDEWIPTLNGHGVTEGGSSGSPLFNSNHKVIGQLYGGCQGHNDNCFNPYNDFSNYGKIHSSWNNGSSCDTRLKDWLDPENSEISSFSGSNVCQQGIVENADLAHKILCNQEEIYQVTKNIFSKDTVFFGATARYIAGREIVLRSGFIAEEGSCFEASISNFDCVPGCHPITFQLSNSIFSSGENLCFSQTNADYFSLRLYTYSGQMVFNRLGSSEHFQNCVPIPPNLSAGVYFATLMLYNDCMEVSETYKVFNVGKKTATLTSDSIESKSFDTKMKNVGVRNLHAEIYPNPARESFQINVLSNQPYAIEIFNSIGNLVYEIDNVNQSSVKINTKGMAKGIYFIKINGRSEIITKKIVVL